MWPENLQVMRTTLETCRGRSWRVRATVGVISSGQGPQTTLGLLISTCHQADFISHCPDDRGSCKGYLTPCGQPSVLANRLLTSRVSVFLRRQSGGKPKMRKSGMRARSPQGIARPGPLFSGESWELTCPWPHLYNEVSWLVTPACSDEMADSPEEERKREREKKKVWGPSEEEWDTQQWQANPLGWWLGVVGLERLERQKWNDEKVKKK